MEAVSVRSSLKRGSAELLILSLLDARRRHGYDLSKSIEIRCVVKRARLDSPSWIRRADGGVTGGTTEDEGSLLRQQIEYYRARACEYDEWFFRQGRYDRGAQHRTAWCGEVAIVEAALRDARLSGDILELACGTGLWTQHLAGDHARVLAVDASPEAIALNRQRVRSQNVEYVVADLFGWAPSRQFDAVFFAFWLSHVPPRLLDAFWRNVRMAVKPSGVVFFVDSLREQTSTATDHHALDASGIATRRLNDGREFEIVKVFHEPARLERQLHDLDWKGQVQSTGQFFLYGCITPSRLDEPSTP